MNETDLLAVAEWRTETCGWRTDECPAGTRLGRFKATVQGTPYRRAAEQATACAAHAGERCCAECAAAPVLWELSARFAAACDAYVQ